MAAPNRGVSTSTSGWKRSAPPRSPWTSAIVARVRPQPGQGIPANNASGQNGVSVSTTAQALATSAPAISARRAQPFVAGRATLVVFRSSADGAGLAAAGRLPDLVQIRRPKEQAEEDVEHGVLHRRVRHAGHLLRLEDLGRQLPHLDQAEDRDEEEDRVDVFLVLERLQFVRHLPYLDDGVDEAEHAEDERHHRIARLAERASAGRR